MRGSNQYKTLAATPTVSRRDTVGVVTGVDGFGVDTEDTGFASYEITVRCGDDDHHFVHDPSSNRWIPQQRCGRCQQIRRVLKRFERYDPADAVGWFTVGFTTIRQVDQWVRHGLGPQDAAKWLKSGLPPEIVQKVKTAGIVSPDRIRAWTDHQFNLSQAVRWERVGVDIDEATQWTALGAGPEQARIWRENGYLPDAAAAYAHTANKPFGSAHRWVKNGFSASEAAKWAMTSSGTAAEWRAARFGPDEAGRWSRTGRGPRTARRWADRGYSDVDAAAWDEWASRTYPGSRRGGSRDRKAWAWAWAQTVRSTREADRWIAVGVPAEDVERFAAHGYTVDTVEAMVQEGARRVTVRCGDVDHQVTVTWKNRRASWHVDDHDVATERAAVAFGGEPPRCLVAVTEAKAARPSMLTPGEALAWVTVNADIQHSRAAIEMKDRWRQQGFPTFDSTVDQLR